MDDSGSNRGLLSFMASLILHGVLWALASSLPPVLKPEEPLEILFQDNKTRPFEFVETQELEKPKELKTQKEVRFRSNQTQRTSLETMARPKHRAPIQASLNSGGQGGRKGKRQKAWSQPLHRSQNLGGLKPQKNRRELPLPGYGGHASRPLIPTYVQQRLPPGVRLGHITALNTEQHRFYSFNQRLLTRFIPLWGDRVRSALYQWLEQNKAPGISQRWITQVEVIMDPKGEILQVQPFRLSGLWSIDEAAIQSFKQIRTVPNPPAEMVDENGYIQLQFQTEVLWVPQPGIRFTQGN